MGQMPVDIVTVNGEPDTHIQAAVSTANSVQRSFVFDYLSEHDAASLRLNAYRRVVASSLLAEIERTRRNVSGYCPYLIAFTTAALDGDGYSNLFGSHNAQAGVAVVTSSNVPSVIIDPERMTAYYLYYIARYTLSFLAPERKVHDDTKNCLFDRKAMKIDLLKSMRAGAVCDACRQDLVSSRAASFPQMQAIDAILAASEAALTRSNVVRKPRVFVGSSREGLPIANKLQELLSFDASMVVWNQNTVFGLGEATLESLERAVVEYDFAVFVFSPDDVLQTRGTTVPVARDNVLFELGLFIGKLGRKRAFVVNPGRNALSLPSDLAGITTATYDPTEADEGARLGPVCNRIRTALQNRRA